MENYYAKVREYLLDMEITIVSENKEEEVFVVSREEDGIVNMVVFVSDPLVIVEQVLFNIKTDSASVYEKILKKNRDVIHGAMVLDDNNNIIFRDTLQVSSLDFNELEATFESLSMLLSEFGEEILTLAK